MFENYIFSGFGYCSGKYKITNGDIEEAVNKGFLQGFNGDRIVNKDNYKKYASNNADPSPLDFFASEIMGFKERYSVTPFPPTKKKLYYSETSLDLAVKAINSAFYDAEISAKEVSAWFVSTVSPHEQAPGIASTIKSYFCKEDNHSACISTISGCAGFLLNLEKAINYLKTHKEAKNVVVAHTETMSSFLTQRVKYVPFITFGDLAAAVIISKIHDEKNFGIIDIENFHDLKMLDFVGVDKQSNLYMDDKLIKDRAIENIPFAARKCLEKSKWQIEDIDYFVPHQTGNIIVKKAAEIIGLESNKIFLEGQKYFGNVSGATIPLCLSLMAEKKLLKDGNKILSATAGVGGNFGAFSYIVHGNKKKNNFYLYDKDLENNNILILGASGSLGFAIAEEAKRRGASLFLHANRNLDKINKLQSDNIFQGDFTDENQLDNYISEIVNLKIVFNHIIIASDNLQENKAMTVNFYANVKIINALIKNRLIKDSILCVSSALEDSKFISNDVWLSSHRAFHGFLSSASYEFLSYGIKTKYVQRAFLESDNSELLNDKFVYSFMNQYGQSEKLQLNDFASDLINYLYLKKVLHFDYKKENAMLLARTGYKLEVDV